MLKHKTAETHNKNDMHHNADEDEDEENSKTVDDSIKLLRQLNIHEEVSEGSDSDSSDEDNENNAGSSDQFMYQRNEISLSDFTLKDDRKGLNNMSSEEIGDNISFLRHLVTLTANAIKSESHEVKTPLLSVFSFII